jgi:glycosyltransferase involved in cell wall biosynthesis
MVPVSSAAPEQTPLVSVVMPAFNAARFIRAAVDSVLAQSYRHFELVVVDDASSDETAAILRDYQKRDDRVRVHRHPINEGVTAALNRGCAIATGEFIARMDADDLCLPERLAQQVAYLRQHPEVGAVGGWVQQVDEYGRPGKIHRPPTDPTLVSWSLFFCSSLVHPLVMMRRDLLERVGCYRPDYPHNEDYDLWFRLSRITKLGNLPDVLLRYRIWPASVSKIAHQAQAEHTARLVRDAILERYGSEIALEDAAALQGLARERYPDSVPAIARLSSLVCRLRDDYLKHEHADRAQRARVDHDAAVKLWLLAALAAPHSPRLALTLASTAARMNPTSAFGFVRKAVRAAATRLPRSGPGQTVSKGWRALQRRALNRVSEP